MYCNDYASFFYHSVLHQIQQKRNWDYKPLCTQNCRAPLFMTTKLSRNRGGGTTKMPIPCMPVNRYITAQVTSLRKKYDHCINQCVQSSWLLSWLGSIFDVAKSNLG